MAATGDHYLLAIESAISGGSIALFDRGELIGERSGQASVSRAEDLLPNISDILAASRISKRQLSRIAVSIGPGSYTGLRIGISTAMGLSKGLGIEHVGVSLFEATLGTYDDSDSIVIVPMGKADVCLARSDGKDSPRVVSPLEAIREIEAKTPSKLMLHSDLLSIFADVDVEVLDIGRNLAKYVGLSAGKPAPWRDLRPIYIQNPRFG